MNFVDKLIDKIYVDKTFLKLGLYETQCIVKLCVSETAKEIQKEANRILNVILESKAFSGDYTSALTNHLACGGDLELFCQDLINQCEVEDGKF